MYAVCADVTIYCTCTIMHRTMYQTHINHYNYIKTYNLRQFGGRLHSCSSSCLHQTQELVECSQIILLILWRLGRRGRLSYFLSNWLANHRVLYRGTRWSESMIRGLHISLQFCYSLKSPRKIYKNVFKYR